MCISQDLCTDVTKDNNEKALEALNATRDIHITT